MRRFAWNVVFLALALPLAAQTGGGRRRVSAPISFYDDADISMPGMLNLSTDFSRAEGPEGVDMGVPSVYASLGLSTRVEVSGGISYARSRFDQIRIDGRGDVYFGPKLLIVPEGKRRPAVAVKPQVEVLGDPSIVNNVLAPGRVNYVLPVMLQKSFDYFRLFNTAGYVTRGIVFDSLVFELNRWSRVTPVVIVSGSRLTRELSLLSDLGLNRSRGDMTGGLAVAVRPGVALYVNAGRSVGRTDANSLQYQVTAGVSFNARLWGKK